MEIHVIFCWHFNKYLTCSQDNQKVSSLLYKFILQMVRHWLRDFERGSRDVCSSKIEMKKQHFLVSVEKKCASDDIEWRIVISQELPLPRLIHLLIRPFDMIQFYIQSLIYGDQHSSLRGRDTAHINTQNMQILLNRYQCDVNIQICNSESQH